MTCIIILSDREDPSALGFPYYWNLFPQKLHQDKGTLIFSNIKANLLNSKVATGDESTAFLHYNSLSKAFNYGKAYCILHHSWEAVSWIACISLPCAQRSLHTLKPGWQFLRIINAVHLDIQDRHRNTDQQHSLFIDTTWQTHEESETMADSAHIGFLSKRQFLHSKDKVRAKNHSFSSRAADSYALVLIISSATCMKPGAWGYSENGAIVHIFPFK